MLVDASYQVSIRRKWQRALIPDSPVKHILHGKELIIGRDRAKWFARPSLSMISP